MSKKQYFDGEWLGEEEVHERTLQLFADTKVKFELEKQRKKKAQEERIRKALESQTTEEEKRSGLLNAFTNGSQGSAAKNSGRVIAMNKTLKLALEQYLKRERRDRKGKYVITTERAEKFSANGIAVFFKRLYTSLGFEGCSSHSGRRTFITNCARKVSLAGGSLRDVMMLSGHRSISNVQFYIDQDEQAQKKLIEMIYNL